MADPSSASGSAPEPPPADAPSAVPEAFRPSLEAWLPAGSTGGPEATLEAGLRALAAALDAEGRERGGAFDLLAADGLVTAACEAAAAGDDPESALRAVLARVAAVAESGA